MPEGANVYDGASTFKVGLPISRSPRLVPYIHMYVEIHTVCAGSIEYHRASAGSTRPTLSPRTVKTEQTNLAAKWSLRFPFQPHGNYVSVDL